MGVITGLFPSMGRRRQKAMPTLEKELDRIVERLALLESEIVLRAEDIRVAERGREVLAEPDEALEPSPQPAVSPVGLASPADASRPRVKAIPVERSFGRPRQPPPEEPQSRLAALVGLEDVDPDLSSNESSPVGTVQ